MKRIIGLFLSAALVFSGLTACGANTQVKSDSHISDDKISVVATIFPEYDWVREVLGENKDEVDLTLLLDSGVDLHSFQPTAEDILNISNCDLFIYVGGESDEWVEDALSEAVNEDMVVINLLEVLGDDVKEEELVEGMEDDEHDHGEEDHDGEDHDHEDEEDHDHENEKDHDEEDHDHEDEEDHEEEEHNHGDEGGYDEHVWLSLRNAKVFVDEIARALGILNPEKKNDYEKNADAYNEKLDALDLLYEEAINAASFDTLLFGDRFPFRYLVDDYGLSYYAAFVGCSAETEASFETITFLANKVDELGLPAVIKLESSDGKIAETIVQNTKNKNAEILDLDSMQSVTAADVSKGVTYLSLMEDNLAAITKALK